MDKHWRLRAAGVGCYDPRIFHPPVPSGKRSRERELQVAAAKRVCAGCSVTEECLEAGRGAPGIWGGLEEHERKPPGIRTLSMKWSPKTELCRSIDEALKA